MARMGSYCKAYMVGTLRTFEEWTENGDNARKNNNTGQVEKGPSTLGERDFLYLQENYVVTDGVFMDENVIYDDITPSWIEFCEGVLKFKVPTYLQTKSAD